MLNYMEKYTLPITKYKTITIYRIDGRVYYTKINTKNKKNKRDWFIMELWPKKLTPKEEARVREWMNDQDLAHRQRQYDKGGQD